MSDTQHSLAIKDDRPYFERALQHGVRFAIISSTRLLTMETEAAKGMVQIAQTFGSQYLRPEIELARQRFVNLISLYLYQETQDDLDTAARMIRDNTLQTLSRGGSGLLKALFAMPEYPMLGESLKGKVEDFLEAWTLRDDLREYDTAKSQRAEYALEIDAASFLARQWNFNLNDLKEEHVEAASFLRSVLFMMAFEEYQCESQVEFASLLAALRKQPKAKAHAHFTALTWLDIPSQFHPILERERGDLIKIDLPKILDKKLPLEKLMHEMRSRYYVEEHDIENTSAYDALVSKEWAKLTQGKTDVDSLMTLFFCLACEAKAKPELPVRSAKTLIKKIRKSGWQPELVSSWITTHAPHEKQEGLLEDWQNFVDEAQHQLFDDWDEHGVDALRFLRTHCHVTEA